MSKLIDREATFRTKNIVDGGVALVGEKKLPQLNLSLRADEIYDFDEKCWVPWDDVEEREITAFLVLIGKKENEIFHYSKVEKAFNWDGKLFKELSNFDFQNFGIQFTTKENEYEGNTTIQVAGIDHYDVEPGRTINKLDTKGLDDLDARYASFQRKRSGEKKPKTVGKPTVPIVKPKKDPEADAADVPESAPPKKAPKKVEKPKKAKKTAGCTQNEAWETCKKAQHESISNEQVVDIWLKAVETEAPDGDEDKMTPGLWAEVRRIVVEQVKDDIPF